MANKENLISQAHKLTPEERSKGGKNSASTRRLKAAVKRALAGKIPKNMEDLRNLLQSEGIETTNDNGIAFAMVLKALSGDKSAAEWIRDISGEKLAEEPKNFENSVIFISGEEEIPE